MTFLTDFNTATPQTLSPRLIPAGTIAKVILKIHAGNYGTEGWLTHNERTGSIYLDTELTITEGPYARRKIFHLIGIEGSKRNSEGEDVWRQAGRTMIRSILEAAHNIHPNDESERANKLRKVANVGDINGLEFAIKIGIENERAGYSSKNRVSLIITPDHSQYKEIMKIIQ